MFRRTRKAVDLTVGAALSGYDGFRHSARSWVARGRSARRSAEDQVEEGVGQLQATGRIYRDQATERVSKEAERLLQRMNLVPREDFDALQRRVRTLEERVAQLESHLEKPVAGEPHPDDAVGNGQG